MFSENEICDAREAFFSLEDDKPTLWDSDGPEARMSSVIARRRP